MFFSEAGTYIPPLPSSKELTPSQFKIPHTIEPQGFGGCVYVCMYACMYVCVCMYVCMYACVYVCLCVYIYTHINTYIHTFIHDIYR